VSCIYRQNQLTRFARVSFSIVVALLLLLGGCAKRQINPRIANYDPRSEDPRSGREFGMLWHQGNPENLVILAFSGGGTRAAAFSYGALEALRRIQIISKSGRKSRMLDEVDVITGVSGGSFTALAYGLYGEKLFDDYETAFLKRDVQGELIARLFDPLNWPALSSTGWGRAELAAQLYDEILFHGATFADLYRAGGPMIFVSATDLSTGARIDFVPLNFDVMCADLGPVRLSRAAAASSAVPLVFSPITINNYGGSCGYQEPSWLRSFTGTANPPRMASRILNRLHELEELDDAKDDPYFHLVDGGISDNLGLRSVLDVLETLDALREAGLPTPLDHIKRIIIFVVDSYPERLTKWNKSEESPGAIPILVRSVAVPIARYSTEIFEELKDVDARWEALRRIRKSLPPANVKDPAMRDVANAPKADIYVIDVSFIALKDKSERDYLNQLPTSFVLPGEAVDRLRAAAAKIILESPEFQHVLMDEGAHMVYEPGTGATP
jgi:NTE family protein